MSRHSAPSIIAPVRRHITALLAATLCSALPTVGVAQGGASAELARTIESRLTGVMPKVVSWRRDIHEHPELSGQETRTAALVAAHLKQLGLEVQTGVGGTGVVGLLRGGRPGPVVALRADMDALPVTELVDLPFRSKVRTQWQGAEVGVMHACGHDNHVAILMGAAEVLAGMKATLPGTVKFIFQPAEEGLGGAAAMVKDGVLTSSGDRGCWFLSEREYGDFELEYEFRLGPRGNSGLALRCLAKGDPAFDGMELQMADFRYNPDAKPSELTGGIYRAIPPSNDLYKPQTWNTLRVSLIGTKLRVELNGKVIQNTDLASHAEQVLRHDGSAAPAIKDRPRKGRIGFQNLSRDGGQVEIRKARIREIGKHD